MRWIPVGKAGVKADRALYTYVVLAADSGARRGELVALKWRDINLENGELVITEK